MQPLVSIIICFYRHCQILYLEHGGKCLESTAFISQHSAYSNIIVP